MEYKGTVLLVEDNVELNANNVRALRMLNYTVHPVLTLAEARAWLNNNEPDVILLDVMLPDGDGIDFCAEIRALPIQTSAHILFLTGKTGHADRLRGLADGGDDYITKPFHPEELQARIEAAMRRRSMARQKKHQTNLNNNGPQQAKNTNEKIRLCAAHYGFTPREAEVLTLLCQGASGTYIAQKLGLKEVTLYAYVSHMLKKSGTDNRAELVVLASSFQAGSSHSGTVSSCVANNDTLLG